MSPRNGGSPTSARKERKDEALSSRLRDAAKELKELRILYEITRISTSSVNLDQILSDAARCLGPFFGGEFFCILYVDETSGRVLVNSCHRGVPEKEAKGMESEVSRGIGLEVIRTGEPVLVRDARQKGQKSTGPVSEVCVPIGVQTRIYGAIDVRSERSDAFSTETLKLLTTAGCNLAKAIEALRSEERYRAVVENALDGVMVLGETGEFIYANDRLAQLLGEPKEDLVGKDFFPYLDGDGIRLLSGRMNLGRRREDEIAPRDLINVFRRDGGVHNVEVNSAVIHDSQGNLNVIAFLKDVTEKRKWEQQVLQAEKLRALGEMASGVAHDFNNALAIILGNTQLLLFNAGEEQRDGLKTIEKVARDSARTVIRLLDFAGRKRREVFYQVDLKQIIQESVEITRAKWKDAVQEKGIHIEVVSELEEVPPVAGNASEFREVMTNLIFNSVEAMPRGGKILIRLFRRSEVVAVEVSDTGIGMNEQVKKKIFEPFFTTKPFVNTGLGLSMVYGIVHRFGGKISVESQEGRGTAFTISLPIGKDGSEEVTAPALMEKAGRNGLRVLVIDDEDLVRDTLEQLFLQARHEVAVAKNGEEGVRLFQARPFDIVLTDLGMPGMSGWEVCKRIKTLHPGTPVGMLTGWGMVVDPAQREESGVNFVIAKPFDFNTVLNAVASALETRTGAGAATIAS
jgi:PAS domain S-box-containing protein